jgi:hypothetical protein
MFHFAGGDALFVALFVLLSITLIEPRWGSAGRWTMLALLALIWGGLSSPAWRVAALATLFLLVVAWRIVMSSGDGNSRLARCMLWTVRFALLGMAVGEVLMTHAQPPSAAPACICVIGDSVTAGLDRGESTWPRRFAEATRVSVRDASQPGATLQSAFKQADGLDDETDPLVMEIGGNDLLAGAPFDDFRRDFEALCQRVCRPGRTVWMCELPLPPLYSRFGYIQRRTCHQHGIRLISKRKFFGILTTAGATVDGIHLSDLGQKLLCELMQSETGCQQQAATDGNYVKCIRPTVD